MRRQLIKHILFFLLGCCLKPVTSIAQGLPIKYLGIEEGLSNNSVRCIYQDSKGFMWFGTFDGLNRYDGYEFKIFRNKFTDSSTLINNWIYSIAEDTYGDLWIGTRQGANRLNKQSGNFSPLYYKSSSNNSQQKITAVIKSIKGSKDGKMFIGSQTLGLLVFEKNNNNGVKINIEGRAESNYEVQSIKIADDKTVWLFVQGFGLGIYDNHSNTIKIVDQSVKNANCIEIDENEIWIGSNAGAYKYNIKSGKNEPVFNKANGTLPSDFIVNITLDRSGDLWFSSNGGGIVILRKATGKLEYISAGIEKKLLSSEAVYIVYEDKDLRKWIGTLRGGVNIIDSHKSKFTTITHEPQNPNTPPSNFIYSFYEASDGKLWIGTDGSGISVWDRQKNLFHNYKSSGKEGDLTDNSITSMTGDYHNNIWFGTFFNGVEKFNKVTNRFEHYPCINPANGQNNKTIYTMYEDSQHNLWAGALRSAEAAGALYIFDEQLNKFEVFDTHLPDIFAMREDRAGKLWAGDLTHLILVDTKNKQHQFYDIGATVHAIYEDNKGNLWVGTEGGGLVLFDRQSRKIVARYTTEQGLCNNTILNILDDNTGGLWLSTFNGLSRFDIDKKQPKNYYYADGLQSNQFTYNAALKLHSGEMVFGGIKGFNIFNPKDISSSGTFSKLVMSEIKVDNVPLEENNAQIFSQDKAGITLLKIPYNKAIVSFDFTALEYYSADKVSYMYYMEGWDKGWTHAGTTRTATYTHLDEGAYTFRVKSTNVAGDWNPQELIVKITILPPWYRTWWAYVLYGLTIAGILIFVYYYRAKQNRLKYETTVAKIIAEKERSERQMKQAELEREMAEHEKDKAEDAKKIAEKETERVKLEKENEINDKRISFFTNISHEFRTPLTLIINPVKDLLEKEGSSNSQKNNNELNIVYRNARRMLSLVDQLLLFRKAESGVDDLHPARLNFYDLCNDVYLCFVQEAKAKKINYLFECNNVELELYGDIEKMEIVFYNIISNAFKYTPEGGTIKFAIIERNDFVEVIITDTGTGISKEVGDRLFDKFYQPVNSKPGFGIGLFLSRNFTEQHKGEITYQSEFGKGTSFLIRLIKGNAHFDENIITTSHIKSPVFLSKLKDQYATPVEIEKKINDGLSELITDRQKILVTDDDAEMREYIINIFKEKFITYEAASGLKGLEMAKQVSPDIIISDIKMDGGDGIAFCKSIKNDSLLNHIPVILLTATSSSDLKLEGIESGADDYITKPFEKEILVARVTNLLKTRSNLQKYFFNEITLNKHDLKISEEYKEFLEKCISIVEAHLDDEKFTVKDLAQEVGMSHSSVYNKIKEISGQSTNAFIRFVRLRKAAELFINSNDNIGQVSFKVGITDKTHFREHFTKLFGIPPTEYIKKFRKPFNGDYGVDKSVFDSNKGE